MITVIRLHLIICTQLKLHIWGKDDNFLLVAVQWVFLFTLKWKTLFRATAWPAEAWNTFNEREWLRQLNAKKLQVLNTHPHTPP